MTTFSLIGSGPSGFEPYRAKPGTAAAGSPEKVHLCASQPKRPSYAVDLEPNVQPQILLDYLAVEEEAGPSGMGD
jgi:hypothetical protein